MFHLRIISKIPQISNYLQNVKLIHTINPLFIKFSPILCAEPLKKKKKIDPQVLKQREERKRKKIEKQIRRLEKNARQLKPIDELETPFEFIDNIKERKRASPVITPEIEEKRILLEKSWAKFKLNCRLNDLQKIDSILQAQEKALAELKLESEELYLEAIQPDHNLLPFSCKGPLYTPPIENYESPDGEYIDVSKKWN